MTFDFVNTLENYKADHSILFSIVRQPLWRFIEKIIVGYISGRLSISGRYVGPVGNQYTQKHNLNISGKYFM